MYWLSSLESMKVAFGMKNYSEYILTGIPLSAKCRAVYKPTNPKPRTATWESFLLLSVFYM